MSLTPQICTLMNRKGNAMLIERTTRSPVLTCVGCLKPVYTRPTLSSLIPFLITACQAKHKTSRGRRSNLGDNWCTHGSSPQGKTNHEHRHKQGSCSQGRFTSQRRPKAVSSTCSIQRSIRSPVVRLSRCYSEICTEKTQRGKRHEQI